MAFTGVEYWRRGLYPDTPTHVPCSDQAAWDAFPAHRRCYDRLRLAHLTGQTAAPVGILTDRRPLVVKPIVNLCGTQLWARYVDAAIPPQPGWFWHSYLDDGPHVSTDAIVDDGQIFWQADTMAFSGRCFGAPAAWHLLPRPLWDWTIDPPPGYRGVINIETIGGIPIDIHLRAAHQFVDLYPPGWAEAVAAFYAGRPWPDLAPVEEGWSIPVWAAPGSELRWQPTCLPGGCWLSPDWYGTGGLRRLGYANHRDRCQAEQHATLIAGRWAPDDSHRYRRRRTAAIR